MLRLRALLAEEQKQQRMGLTLRGVIVLLTGVVCGLGMALGSTVWTAFAGRAKATAAPLDPTIESAALVAEVIDRVRREYVDRVDDKRIVEAAIRGIVADLDQHSTFLDADEA
jgi:carboxyl-terminal processing protease